MQEFEVSPEEKKAWREREQARLDDGTYTPLPGNWINMRWFWKDDNYSGYRYPDHFTHISIDKVAMIAFTESEQKGARDRQTRMSPGKYLARFFSDVLTKTEIQALATQMGAQYNDDAELSFATDADEFEHVYTTGPRSCMSHSASHFDSDGVHPVRVYAGFDLHLAYLTREDRITARALCWPEKLVYGRLYGDHVRLENALKKLGYNNGSLSGARITRLMHDCDTYVIPYLDYLAGAIDKKTHLMLTDGTHSGRTCCAADRQNGISEDRYTCADCGDGVDPDDCQQNDNGYYCNHCWNDRYGYCERTEDNVPLDELEEVRVSRSNATGNYRTQQWGEYARSEYAFFCDRDQVYYSTDRWEPTDVEGDTWGPEAVERDAVLCEATDEYFHRDHVVTLEDGTVWSKDHFDDHGVTIDGMLYDKDDLPDGVELPEEVVADPAQIELPLTTGLHVKRIDSPEGDRWQVMDGDEPVGVHAYYVKRNAENALKHYAAERAALAARPIVVGCMVECIEGYNGTGFTAGHRYKVTRVFTEHGTPRISVEYDDNARANGWLAAKFRFHSMPQIGLHIRHEPDAHPTFPYRLYDGEQWVNGWAEMRYAQSGLERLLHIREAEQRGLHIRHEPNDEFKWKVFHNDVYLDGFADQPGAQNFHDELLHNNRSLTAHISLRTRNPLRNFTQAPEEVA